MELFNKYKNKDFAYITNYINSCINDMDLALNPESLREQLIGSTQNTFEEFINSLVNKYDGLSTKSPNADILYESNGKMLPIRQNYIPIRTTFAEKAWLFYILKNSKADLFLDSDVKEKLINALSSSIDSPIKEDYIDIRNFSDANSLEITPDMISNFRNIVTAITEHRHLTLTNKTFSGVEYTHQSVIPYKLEYAAQFDSFSLSAYPLNIKRPVKMNLQNISDVVIGEPVKDYENFVKKFEKMLSDTREKEPVIIEISNEDEAYDRCSYIFSTYEKICYENESGNLIMKIYYYRFQQDDIIRNILFLGPYIKIISPQKMVHLVINSLKETYKKYNAGK